MVKKRLKRFAAFVMTLCIVGTMPDYSMITAYAAPPTAVVIADEDKDVFVVEDENKETTDMGHSETISFEIANAPDEGAYLAFADGSANYSDANVEATINNTNHTISFTGVSRGFISDLPVYAFNSSTTSRISGATSNIDVYVCRSFDEDTVTVTPGSVTYTGNIAVPSFTIVDNATSTTLVQDNHYSVLSSAAAVTDEDGTTYDKIKAGTQKVVLRAVNESLYYGDYTATYTISPWDLADALTTTAVNWSDDGVLQYTGSLITPTSTDGDAEEYFTIAGLTEGEDYEITGYSNNKSVGVASIALAGLGNYAGSAETNFTIVKDLSSSAISISFPGIDNTNITYDGAEHILTPNVRNNTDSNTVLTEGVDYTLTYEDEAGTSYSYDSVSGKYLDSSSNEYDFTNAGVKKAVVTANGGSYYVNSGSLSYAIVPKSILSCIAVSELPSQVNNAAFLAGDVDGLIVTRDGTENGTALVKDTEYTVDVVVDDDHGVADITVAGIGNYTGSYTFEDVVIGTDIASANITLFSDDGTTVYPYEKGGVSPDFVVTYNFEDLAEGTDYTARFTNNTELGTATLTVQGKGRFAGTVSVDFTIVEGDLEADDMSILLDDDYLERSGATVYFNGAYFDNASYAGANAIDPNMAVTQNGIALEKDVDFTISATYNLRAGYASLGDQVNIGTYDVTITGINNYDGSVAVKSYNVYKSPLSNNASMTLALGGTSFSYTGSPIMLSPTAGSTRKIKVFQGGNTDDYSYELASGTDYEISYLDELGDEYTYDSVSTSPTYEKYVNASGDEYDFTNVGTKTIKFTGKGPYAGTATLSYAIGGVSISRGTFAVADKPYTGSAVELDGTEFTATVSGNTLTYGVDFEIVPGTYQNNTRYGYGAASVTVQGIGNYSGTKTVNFYIKKELSHSDITVTYTASHTYTGNAIEPEIQVKDGNRALVFGEDYTVTYNNNVDVGSTAEIILAGEGDSYMGSRTENFTITRYALSDIDDENITYDENLSYEYDGNEKQPTLADLNFKFAGEVPAVGTYSLTYLDNVDAGTAYAIFSPNSTSDLSGSVAIPFTITAKAFAADITATLGGAYNAASSYFYTGTERKLSTRYITVTDGTLGSTLSYGTDYTISYLNDINAGTSAVNALFNETATYVGPVAILTGRGNYSGKWVVGYTINPYDIGTKTFTTSADTTAVYYDGTEKTPLITVRISSGTLVAGDDYDITYSDNVNAGTASYEIDLASSGNFTDSTVSNSSPDYLKRSGTFTINPKPISEIEITGLRTKTVGSNTYLYLPNQEEDENGNPVVPALDAFITNANGKQTLTVGTDYDVTAAGNNVTPNRNDVAEEDVALNTSSYPYITISGDAGSSGNLTGDITIYFNIRAGIRAEWNEDVSNLSFTGKVVEPEVAVYYGDTILQLVEGRDYTITYDDNINAKDETGNDVEHYALVEGIGEYGGTKKLTFTLESITLPDEADMDPNYYAVVGNRVSFMGATGVDVTNLYGTTVVYYPDGNALTDPDAGNKYDLVTHGDIEHFTADLTASSGTVTASTGLKNACLHNFRLPHAWAYTVTLTVGARELGTVDSYADYISVDPIANQIYTGAHINLTGEVTVYDKYRNGQGNFDASARTSDFYQLVEGRDYVLYYAENAEALGTVQNVGTNTVYIIGAGDYTGTIKKDYTVVSSIATGSATAYASYYTGEPQTPVLNVTVNGDTLTADEDYTIEVFDATGATSYGTTATNAGTYRVVITGAGDYATDDSVTINCNWTIGRKSITDADISIRGINASYTYNGNNFLPSPMVYYGDNLLVENVDYIVAYSSSEDKNPGTYTATVKGVNNFDDRKDFTYVVGNNFIEGTGNDNIVVEIENSTLKYNGTDRTNDIGLTVKLGNGTALTQGEDYEYQVLNDVGAYPVNAGDYTVFISGKGTYAGLIEKTITIEPEDITALTLGEVTDSYVYDGSEHEPTPSVTWNGADVSSLVGTDFVFNYYNNINATDPLNKATVTLRPTLNGNFTDANGDLPPVTFDIAPRQITDNDDIEITVSTNAAGNVYLQYLGTRPGVTVVDNGILVAGTPYNMQAGVDFTVEFTNNTTVSDPNSMAVATITGTGNYTGTKSKAFYIEKYPMSETTVNLTDATDFDYTGYEIKPALTVRDNDGTDLVLDQDYTVEYTDNINTGTATATLTATEEGRFTGSTTITFDINKVDVSDAKITVAPIENQLVNVTPELTITLTTDANTVYTLVQDVDFTVVALTNNQVTVDDDTKHATASITGIGNFEGTRSENFEVGHDINEYIDASISETTFSYDGTEKKPAVTVTMKTAENLVEAVFDDNGAYVSGDYKIVYDDDTKAVGPHTVRVIGVGNYGGTYTGASLDYTIGAYDFTNHVTDAVVGSVNDAGEIVPEELTFNGEVQTPNVAITVDIDGTAYNLRQGVDFTVTYDDASSKDAGTYTYTVEGTGNYIGNAGPFEYTIARKDITANMDFTLTNPATRYTGAELTPEFALKDMARDTAGGIFTTTDTGNYLLTDADYEVEDLTDNIYPGTASMTITGTGNYTGTTGTINFEIYAKLDEDATVETVEPQIYTGSAITPEPEVKVGDMVLEKDVDFAYQYSDNVEKGVATITVVPVDTVHFTESATANFDIAESIADGVMTLPYNDATSYYYTGSPITFTTANPVVVKVGDTVLTAGTDYSLSYTNNTAAGTATVTATALTGSGYAGSISRQFTIVKRSLSASAASLSLSKSSFDYTGSAITVANYVTVKYGSTTLTNGTDYTLSYKNNIKVGTATVTATGKGIYAGTISKTFTIKESSKKTNINACTVNWDATVRYTGKATAPTVTVKKGSTTLKKGTDYTVKYVNNINPGVASIRITGTGKYTSVKTVPYKIEVPAMGKVTVKKTTATTAKLSWTKISNVDGYVVYDASDLTTILATFKGSSTSGTVKKLKAGTRYRFVVRAYVKANGAPHYGSFSDKATAVTKPKKPSVTVKAGTKSVTVSWKKVKSGTGYVVYRSTSKKGTYTKVKTITGNSTLKYKNSGLITGKTYYYKVRAYTKIDGKKYYSSYSKVKSAKAK